MNNSNSDSDRELLRNACNHLISSTNTIQKGEKNGVCNWVKSMPIIIFQSKEDEKKSHALDEFKSSMLNASVNGRNGANLFDSFPFCGFRFSFVHFPFSSIPLPYSTISCIHVPNLCSLLCCHHSFFVVSEIDFCRSSFVFGNWCITNGCKIA